MRLVHSAARLAPELSSLAMNLPCDCIFLSPRLELCLPISKWE